ncbi:TPA: hypothetical protein I8287_004124 [Kluyvera intermedia]|jgi:hypothetical protein|uniref:Uncharacterized protein n=1 Tax=Kluyvera intermedia TaxID=61648 RepID=A0ABX3UI28_KLUIN|nr:hypothetical protein [Kluyvera intermedia]ORJ51052.1 hypothetical protein B2M27_06280 [Kluyvera intermedia]HAU8266420.1 hypothetical protein [Kluyvera intermedia]
MVDIESVLIEVTRHQSHELNAADNRDIRCRVAGTLAVKERHRQCMTAPEYRCSKPAPRR